MSMNTHSFQWLTNCKAPHVDGSLLHFLVTKAALTPSKLVKAAGNALSPAFGYVEAAGIHITAAMNANIGMNG